MKFADAPIGMKVIYVENIDNEVRYVTYIRKEGVAKFTTNPDKPTVFVPAYRISTNTRLARHHTKICKYQPY